MLLLDNLLFLDILLDVKDLFLCLLNLFGKLCVGRYGLGRGDDKTKRGEDDSRNPPKMMTFFQSKFFFLPIVVLRDYRPKIVSSNSIGDIHLPVVVALWVGAFVILDELVIAQANPVELWLLPSAQGAMFPEIIIRIVSLRGFSCSHGNSFHI